MKPRDLLAAAEGARVTPTGIVALDRVTTTERWLERRRLGIGGTDAAAITGHNPYKGPLAVYFEKVLEVRPERHPTPQDPRWWGLALEGPLRDAFEHETGLTVVDAPRLLRHEQRPWQQASLDGLVYDADEPLGIFESKTGGLRQSAAWPEDDPEVIPAAYLVQGMHYMAVTGLNNVWFAALIGGQRFIVRKLARDLDAEQMLARREEDFWQHVQDRIPPPADGTSSATNALRDAFPTGDETDIVLDSDAWLAVERYRHAHREHLAWKQEKEKAAQELQLRLGDASVGYYDERKAITWHNVTTRQWDTRALENDHPELATKYKITKTTRPFKVPALYWKDE